MAALQADPPASQVPAAGGIVSHNLVNSGAARLVFKVPSPALAEPRRFARRTTRSIGSSPSSASWNLERSRLWRSHAHPAHPRTTSSSFNSPRSAGKAAGEGQVPIDATDAQTAFQGAQQVGELTLPVSAQ